MKSAQNSKAPTVKVTHSQCHHSVDNARKSRNEVDSDEWHHQTIDSLCKWNFRYQFELSKYNQQKLILTCQTPTRNTIDGITLNAMMTAMMFSREYVVSNTTEINPKDE